MKIFAGFSVNFHYGYYVWRLKKYVHNVWEAEITLPIYVHTVFPEPDHD